MTQRVMFAALGVSAFSLALLPALSNDAVAQGKKDSVVLGMVLEPPGLDPTMGAAAAIGEITHYNIFEGLTKINADGSVTPLLAQSWSISEDAKTYTFKLRQGVKFQDGESFGSADVKFTFQRDAAEASTNKRKAIFANMVNIDTPDPATVVITLKDTNPMLLFNLGENTAVILDPKSAEGDATHPVGTGPFKFDSWAKGSAVTLVKWDGYRDPASIKLNKVTFRIINDPAAQTAALLAGDVDAIPRFGAAEALGQFRNDPRFTITEGDTEGKTIIGINNKKKPFDDVRVRRAIAYAIDRKAIIDGAMNGLGKPIGSHTVPLDPGYVDLTGMYPHDPEKAKALLKEAGVATPLQVSLKLPPPAYARRGGEIVAAELAQVGIEAKIENLEWANWLDGVYKNKNFDLTIISHVEPQDMIIYTNPNYYFQYDSQKFRDIMKMVASSADPKVQMKWLGDAQRQLAEDCVNVYMFELMQTTVAKKELKGLWRNSPIFANDMSVVYWE
ncbi:MAG TPA: ABC transporter substrate-binding protein [Candidatus Cybelea sp.]|nr:ABC transporter substrate-binding protein [Candidatus Cybelea sp.]